MLNNKTNSFLNISSLTSSRLIMYAFCTSAFLISSNSFAANDELQNIAEGVHNIASGSGMKIGLISASVSCIIAGLINNAILKPMMALGGVAGVSPLILDWINTKYTILI